MTTTTVKIKHKSNITERQNRPRKDKMNYSKINDSIKSNKTSNTIVNVIKDTSQNIIDKAKANLFGTPETSVITKNQLKLNDKTPFQSSDKNNSTLTDTIPHKNESNQNNQNETVDNTNNDDKSIKIPCRMDNILLPLRTITKTYQKYKIKSKMHLKFYLLLKKWQNFANVPKLIIKTNKN